MVTKVLSSNDERGVVSPQEIGPQQQVGAMQGSPVFVWDHRTNQFGVLNQGFLAELCLLAEKAYTLNKLDERNGVDVTIPEGAEEGSVHEGEIEVPAGEVWYVNRLQVVCPAADATGTCTYNIRVSHWERNYFAQGQDPAVDDEVDTDVTAAGELGEELRLVAGDKLTLRLTATAGYTADSEHRLNVFGRVGKRLA